MYPWRWPDLPRWHAQVNGLVRRQRLRRVDVKMPLDHADLHCTLYTDLCNVSVEHITQTTECLSQSYCQLLSPIGPFFYRLEKALYQCGITYATAIGISHGSDMVSSPISPPASQSINKDDIYPTNHITYISQQTNSINSPAINPPADSFIDNSVKKTTLRSLRNKQHKCTTPKQYHNWQKHFQCRLCWNCKCVCCRCSRSQLIFLMNLVAHSKS